MSSLLQHEQRAILEAIPDMVFVMDPEGVYLDFKLDKNHLLIEELIGRNVRELGFISPELASQVIDKLQQSIDTSQIQHLEYQLDGNIGGVLRPCYYEARFAPMGQTRVLMVVRDVTERKMNELALQEAREQEHAILTALPDQVFIMDKYATYLDHRNTLVTSSEPLIGRTVYELNYIPKATAKQIHQHVRLALQKQAITSLEYKLETSHYEARFVPLSKERVLCIVRDISLQKHLEGESRQIAEQNQRQAKETELLEQVRTLITAKTDLDLLIKTVNQATHDILGYELIALSLLQGEYLEIKDLVGYSRVLPKFPAYEGVEGRVLRSGKAELIKHVKQDPDYFEVEPNTQSEICVPLFIKGHTAGVLIVESVKTVLQESDLRLLTKLGAYVSLALEQAWLYQEFQSSELRYRELIENASDIIYRTDLSGRFTYSNSVATRLLGYSEQEIIGKHYLDLVRPDYHVETQSFYLKQVQLKEPNSYFEFPAVSIDGQEIWLGQNVQLVWEQQKLVGMQAVARDITQSKHMKEALLKQAGDLSRANAELKQFAFVAAHDLQEPLRKIQAFGDRLKHNYHHVLDEQGQDYLARMHASATRMRRLIDDLLLFAKTNKQNHHQVSLEQTMKEVLSDLQDRLDETQAHIEVGPLPSLEADPVQMRQLFQNLLSNALKFHKPECPPVVRVFSSFADGVHSIYMEDNGIGFDEHYKDRIFNVFQRLHSREKYEGTGMGLAIVRKIVEGHQGTIDVHSKVGQGTTFIIRLPDKAIDPSKTRLEVLA